MNRTNIISKDDLFDIYYCSAYKQNECPYFEPVSMQINSCAFAMHGYDITCENKKAILEFEMLR